MADIEVREMIAAFSVGCMDRENFVQFKEYINSGGALPAGQLGELQNVVSLIPSILDIESPRVELKNELAKKLLTIHRRDKEMPEENKTSPEETIEEEPKKKSRVTIAEKTRVETTESSNEELDFEDSIAKETYSGRGMSLLTKGTFIPFLIIIMLFIVTVIILFNMKTGYDDEIALLKSNVESISANLKNADKFVNENKVLIDFLTKKDLVLLDLYNESDPASPNKVLLSLNDEEALIELKNLPPPELNEAYQVWVVSKRSTISLGLITKINESNFAILTGIGKFNAGLIDSVKVTLEPRIGSEMPIGRVLLKGTM